MKTAVAVLLLAFVGTVDALYLALQHKSGPVPCTLTGGCTEVLNSRFSEVAGIPVSWYGLGFYVTALGAAVFELSGRAGSLRWLAVPSAAALLVSIILVGIQAFVLQAFCQYCLLSALLSTAIFAAVWYPRSRSG